MRIGIDISQAAYSATGVGQYTINLVTELLRLDHKNRYSLLFSSLRRSPPEEIIGLRKFIKRLYLPPRVLEIFWNKLHVLPVEKLIGNQDVFHTSDWTEPPSLSPKVTTIHDLVVYKYPETLPRRIISTHKRKLHFVKKESRLVIADSLSTKADLVSLLGIEARKVRVIYLGVDDTFSPRSRPEVNKVLQKYRIEGNYILSVGTREPRKNLLRSIKAFRELKKENPDLADLAFVVIGRLGWGKDMSKLNQNSDIKIINFVEKEDLVAFYSGAHCMVYPSLYEGFGLPVLEALRSGTLVVTSNRGSLEEIAGPSIVINPESTTAIKQGMQIALETSNKKRLEQIASGRRWAAKFTWEKTARETLKVYEEAAC